MNYNNVVDHLRLWCLDKARGYQKAYADGGYGGVTYVGYQAAYELEFKLSTLIDRSFESLEALKKEILELLEVHYEPSVRNPQNSVAKHIIDKIQREFRCFLEEVIAKGETLEKRSVPYSRVIVGEEALALQERFRSVWGYASTAYWFPLMGDEPREISEKIFIMAHYFEPYQKAFEQRIGLPHTRLYSCGECNFRPPHCLETVELEEYGGLETMYTDKDFSWAIYFSHENTVSFAGAIVPMVQELLVKEKEHWNRFEWDR